MIDLFNKQFLLNRLKDEHKNQGRLVVAFDYNVVCDLESNPISIILNLLKECAKLEFDLILFTVDEDPESISSKVRWLVSQGLWKYKSSHFFVNTSPILSLSKKPFYNILLDDRAGLKESYSLLKEIIEYINNSKLKEHEIQKETCKS